MLIKKIVTLVVMSVLCLSGVSQELVSNDEIVMINPKALDIKIASSFNGEYLVRLEPFYFDNKQLINRPVAYVFRWKKENYAYQKKFILLTAFPKKIFVSDSGVIVTVGKHSYDKGGDLVTLYNHKGREAFDGGDNLETFSTAHYERRWICWSMPIEVNDGRLLLTDLFGNQIMIDLDLREIKRTRIKNGSVCK